MGIIHHMTAPTDSMKITVRPYRHYDYDQFRWLRDRTPPAGQISREPTPWKEFLDDIDSNFIGAWVAVETEEDQESIVGSAMVQKVEVESVGPPVPNALRVRTPAVRLHEFRVAPERQRRGIGTLMHAFVITSTSVSVLRLDGSRTPPAG